MLVISIIALVAVYFIAYAVASTKYPYKKVYWAFEAAHFAAGFFVAMFFSNFFSEPREIVAATFAIGLLWEIWEWIAWNVPSLRKKVFKMGTITLPDTALDLVLDTFGGVVFTLILL